MAELGSKEATAAQKAEAENQAVMAKAHKAALAGNPPTSVKLKRIHGAEFRDGYVYNEQKIDTYEQAIMRPINVGMCSELAHALGEAADAAPLVISVGGKRMMMDGHISVEPIGGSIILKLAGHIAKQNPPKEKAVKESK
jgi:hypothetical protein